MGFAVRASTRAPPTLSRLRGRNPKIVISPGRRAPYAGVTLGLLTTILAFDNTHEHRLSAVQPRGSKSVRLKRPTVRPRFRADSLSPTWLVEPQSLVLAARGDQHTFLAGGVQLSPFASGVGQVVRLGSPRDVLPRLVSESTRTLAHSPTPYVAPRRTSRRSPRWTTRDQGSHVLSHPREGIGARAPKAPFTIDTRSGR